MSRSVRTAATAAATTAALGAAGVVVVVASTAPAAARSDDVQGRYAGTSVTAPADCTSPVGLCAQGTLSGGLKGNYTWRASSLTATADTPTTGVATYTADMTVSTRRGMFTCKDAGVLGTGPEDATASVCVLVAGTGAYAGATGALQLVGHAPSSSPTGTYSGVVRERTG